MGKLAISMAIFNRFLYVSHYQRTARPEDTCPCSEMQLMKASSTRPSPAPKKPSKIMRKWWENDGKMMGK
jgi:hypothetical protein